MKLRAFIILIAIIESVVALILERGGQEYVSLLIGGAIAFMIAELLRPASDGSERRRDGL